MERSNNLKYSIIVPVYNLENYIEECVNSILRQTYPNLELIVVDDGSKDKSVALCQMIAENDNRMKVFQGEHRGVSSARNRGLTRTTGDYVFFVDGDDFIEKDYIEKADGILSKSQADILVTNRYYYYDNNNGKRIDKEMYPLVKAVKEKEISILDYILDNHYVLPGGVSFNIYKRAFLAAHKCSFIENIKWFEDLDFFLQVMSQNPTYEVTDIKYYYYRRKRKDSAVTEVTTQKILDKMDVIRKWNDYITENVSDDDPFSKVKGWLQREYYVNFAFCVPWNSSNIDYNILTQYILQDEEIWGERNPDFGNRIKRKGLKKTIVSIKLKEYSKAILGIRG